MISRSRQRGKNPTSRALNFGESRFLGGSQRGCQLRFYVSISNDHNNNKHWSPGKQNLLFPEGPALSDVLCDFFALFPRSEILAGNSFIVRCHVISKQPMRPRAVEKKFPAIKQSDCKDISDYLKTSFDHYPNRHKASIYCLPATCLDCE